MDHENHKVNYDKNFFDNNNKNDNNNVNNCYEHTFDNNNNNNNDNDNDNDNNNNNVQSQQHQQQHSIQQQKQTTTSSSSHIMKDESSNNNNTANNNTNTRPSLNIIPNRNEPIIRRSNIFTNHKLKTGLFPYMYNITSQNGEDGIIQKIFDLIDNHGEDSSRNNNTNKKIRWCIDVGAWDGIHLSNTRQLLINNKNDKKKNSKQTNNKNDNDTNDNDMNNNDNDNDNNNDTIWYGILIEADDIKFQTLQQLYKNNMNIHCIHATVSVQHQSSSSITSLLNTLQQQVIQYNSIQQQEQHNMQQQKQDEVSSSQILMTVTIPTIIDFISIDIDGNDYWILYNILVCQNKYHINVICIEYNPTIPYDVIYIPPYNDNIRHGCSFMSLYELCIQYNYICIITTLYNAFFVHRNNIYEPYIQTLIPDISFQYIIKDYPYLSMGTTLYQLYDGTIKLNGCQKLLWHRIPFHEEQFQIINNTLSTSNQNHSTSTTTRTFPFAPNHNQSSSSTIQQQQQQYSNNTTTTATSNYSSFNWNNVVDVSSYCCDGNESQDDNNDIKKHQCSILLYEKLINHGGFCYINGTGIQSLLCTDTLNWTHNFLHNVDESVRRSCLSKKDRARRGYSPMNTENFASLYNYNYYNNQNNNTKNQGNNENETKNMTKNSHNNNNNNMNHNDLVLKFRIGQSTDNGKQHRQQQQQQQQQQREIKLNHIQNDESNKAIDETIVSMKANDINHSPKASSSSSSSSSSSLLQPNVWPNHNDWSDNELFRSTLEQYYDHITYIAKNILCAICTGIVHHHPILFESLSIFLDDDNDNRHDDDDDDDDKKEDERNHSSTDVDSTILTILGYRPNTSRHKGKQKGRPLVAAHTDVGIITILLFDHGNCATLQRKDITTTKKKTKKNSNHNNVKIAEHDCDEDDENDEDEDEDEKWIDVTLPHPIPTNDPVFVINIADCLSDLTGRIIPSTLHRIIPNPGGTIPRNCCALFVGLNPNQIMKFPSLSSQGRHNNSNNKNDENENDESLVNDHRNNKDDDEGCTMTYEEWRKRRIQSAQQQMVRFKTKM